MLSYLSNVFAIQQEVDWMALEMLPAIPPTWKVRNVNLCVDKMASFKEKVVDHLKEKEIENSELYNHLITCSFYRKLKEQVLSDLKLKIETAKELDIEQKQILKDLKGKSFIWIIKYIWRQ